MSMSVLSKDYVIKLSDGSKWAVPVSVIAQNRAEFFSDNFNGDVEKSLIEDTVPLFKSDFSNIYKWAVEKMKWEQVRGYARCVSYPNLNWDKEWINAEYEID